MGFPPINVNNAIDDSKHNYQPTFNNIYRDRDRAVDNSDDDLRATGAALVNQNKMLDRLSINNDSNVLTNDNCINPNMRTINTLKNGYFVMPDFNNSLTEFIGRETGKETQFWLNSIKSVAKLHE